MLKSAYPADITRKVRILKGIPLKGRLYPKVFRFEDVLSYDMILINIK